MPPAWRTIPRGSLSIGEAPVISIPIAVALFFMIYPIMVKIDFAEVLKAGKNIKPVSLALFGSWAIKPLRCMRSPFFCWARCFPGSSARMQSTLLQDHIFSL